jgi:hypothetical protein
VHQQQDAGTLPIRQAQAANGSSKSAQASSAAGAGARSAGGHTQPSPTLSDLGFIDASLSTGTRPLNQQHRDVPTGASHAAADLADLSFEQRLALLCAPDAQDATRQERMDEVVGVRPQLPTDRQVLPPAGPQAAAVDNLHLLEQQEKAWLDASSTAGPAKRVGRRSSSMSGTAHTEYNKKQHTGNVASIATQTTPQLLKTASKQVSSQTQDLTVRSRPRLGALMPASRLMSVARRAIACRHLAHKSCSETHCYNQH